MRRFQFSFPTLLFGISFVLCMVVALLFISRQSADDAYASSASKSRPASVARSGDEELVSLPSEALPPGPITYPTTAQASASEAAPGVNTVSPSPTPAGSILDQAVSARNARAASMNGGTEPATVGAAYSVQTAPPAPALPGAAPSAVVPGMEGRSPQEIARAVTGKNPYELVSVSMPQGQPPVAAPPIAYPPGMEPHYTPIPAPQARQAFTPARTPWYRIESNDPENAYSLANQARGVQVPTPIYGAPAWPTDATRPNQRLFQLPSGSPAQGQPASYLPQETTMWHTRPTPAAPSLSADPSYAGTPDSWSGTGALNAAMSPVAGFEDLESPAALPLVTITPVAGEQVPSSSPAPSSMPVSTPVPTRSPAEIAAMAAAQATPARPETVQVAKKGAEVTIYGVSPGHGRPDAATHSTPDVQEAIRKLQAYSGQIPPQPGQSAAAVAAVPTPAQPLISSTLPGTGPIRYLEQARLESQGNALAGSPAFDKPLPAEIAERLEEPTAETDVAAQVGDNELTAKEVNRRVEVMLKVQGKTADEDRRIVLGRMAAEEWAQKSALAAEARRQGVTVSDSEVAEYMARTKERFGDKLESALRSSGFSEAEIQEEMRNSALCEKLIESTIEKKFDDAKLKQVYEQNPSEFQPSRRLRLMEIVKEKPADAAGAREAKRRAEDLHRQVSSGGADFSRLAAEQSDAPSRANAGDLGWIDDRNASRITPQMAKALESLKPGQVSGVVENDDSYAVYKLVEVEEPKSGFEGARERVIASLHERVRDELYEQAKKQSPVMLAHKDRKTKGSKITRAGSSAPSRSRETASSVSSRPVRTLDSQERDRSTDPSPAPRLSDQPEQLQNPLTPGTPADLEQAMAPAEGEAPTERRGGVFSRLVRGLTGRDGSSRSASEESAPSAAVEMPHSETAAASARPEHMAASNHSAPAAETAQPAPNQPEGFGGPTDQLGAPEEPERGGLRGMFSRFRRN